VLLNSVLDRLPGLRLDPLLMIRTSTG